MIEPTDLLLTAPAVLAGAGAGFYAGQRWAKGRYWPGPKPERAPAEVVEDADPGPDEEEAAEARSLVSQRRAGVPLAELAADAEDDAEEAYPVLPVSVTVPPRLAELMRPAARALPPAEALEVLEDAAPGGQIHASPAAMEALTEADVVERRAELGADPVVRAEHIAELLSDMSDELQDQADAELAAELRAKEDAAAEKARMAKPKKAKPQARTLPIVRRDPEPAPPVAAAALEAPPWVKWNDPSMLATTPAPAPEAPADPECAPPEPGTFDAGHEPVCAPEPVAAPETPAYDPPPVYEAPAPSYDPPAPSYDPPSYDSGSSSSYDSGGGGGFSGGE